MPPESHPPFGVSGIDRTADGSAPARASRRLLFALFAGSGVAALVLQVVWTRWMVLALGSSTHATVVVMAVFMAGLGVGAFAGGRAADARPQRALRLFAAAETGIGLWAWLSVLLVGRWLPNVSAGIARMLDSETLPIAARTLLAVLVLAPPTLLMGATLPFLTRWALSAGLLPGRSVGDFYSVNTLGGAAGTLLASFVLIDRLGLSASAAAAGTVNIAVGLVALLVLGGSRGRSEAGDRSQLVEPESARRWSFAPAAIGYLVSGFVGLGLEVVSYRVLSARIGSSVYGFTVMLAAFLAGIGLGSVALSRRVDRVRHPIAWIGVVLGGLAFGIGVAKWAYGTDVWTWPTRHVPGWWIASPWSYSIELMASFPLVARVAAEAPSRAAGRLGLAYACNTGGAVLGAVLCGSVLIPLVGTASTLTILCCVAGGAGLVMAAPSGGMRALRLRVALAAAVLTAGGVPVGWRSDPVRAALGAWSRGSAMLVFREGPVQAAAVVEESSDLQLDFRRVVADQTSFAATHLRARRYMSLLGHLPVLWSEKADSALVICFGTGTTARAIATHPEIARIDVADISPEVVGFAPLFRDVNRDVLSDPRVHLNIDDGRHVVLAASRSWDVITLEPPPPRDSGVVSLYSADFYRLARSKLRPGGVVAQWCPLESQSQLEVRMVVKTFLDAFPSVIAFLPVERDLILLGSDRPLRLSPTLLAKRTTAPSVKESLAEIGCADEADLLATAVAGRASLQALAGGVPSITDDRPRIEYFARFGRYVPRPDPAPFVGSPPSIDELVATPSPSGLRERFDAARGALLASLRSGWARTDRQGEAYVKLALDAVRARPTNPYYLWAAGPSDEHLERLTSRAERVQKDPRLWLAVGLREAQRGRADRAIRSLRRTLDLGLEDPDALYNLGLLITARDPQSSEGSQHLRRLIAIDPGSARSREAERLLEGRSR